MNPNNFEQNKETLRLELEAELEEKSAKILSRLVTEITSDPRTITASILGVDIQEVIKKVVSEKLDDYTKEE